MESLLVRMILLIQQQGVWHYNQEEFERLSPSEKLRTPLASAHSKAVVIRRPKILPSLKTVPMT